MRLGIRKSVSLIEALCEISSASRQPLCINSSTVNQLNLPLLTNAAWNGIVSGLDRKDIECIGQQVLSGGDTIVTGFIVWRRGETLRSATAVENIVGILSNPANYARRSVSAGDVNLSTDRYAIERELNVLRAAAGIVPGPDGVALLDCASKSEGKLAAFKALEAQELETIGFEESVKSIKSLTGMPFDFEDIDYARRSRIRDLLGRMLARGFPKRRARKLIAEATEISGSNIREWTQSVKAEAPSTGPVATLVSDDV